MKRTLFAVLVVAGAIGVASTAAAGPKSAFGKLAPGDQVAVTPSQVPALLGTLGLDAPADSCIGNPALPKCPKVSEVIVQVPSTWASGNAGLPASQIAGGIAGSASPTTAGTPYGPSAAPARSTSSARKAMAFNCYVHGGDPIDVYYSGYPHVHIQGLAENECGSVTYQEVTGDVQRLVSGSWQGVASCFSYANGAGYISCVSDYPCPFNLTVSYWRNQALGYSIYQGVGYTGSNTSQAWGYSCS